MRMDFEFTEAEPLVECIEKYKDKLAGRQITHYYRDRQTGKGVSPAVFVVGDMAITVSYMWYSWLTVTVVDKERFFADTSLNFLYKDIPGSSNVWYDEYPFDDMGFIGGQIKDIIVRRFSDKHMTHPSLGRVRPEGGDYFSKITVQMSNGKDFYICGADAIFDGYMDVWE